MTVRHRLATLAALTLAIDAAAAQLPAQLPAQSLVPPAAGSEGQPLAIGTVHTLRSTVMGGDRGIVVRLPASYAAEPARRYDVVYLIDGGPEQDFPHIAGLAQSAEVNGTFAPLIIVGVETVERRAEITPPVANPAPYLAELGATPGAAARFRRFIADEVKPWVERRFRTSGTDAVMGESLAGLFVVDTLFATPDLFDDYIAVSPSLWWDDLRLGRNAAASLARLPTGRRRLYLALADEGYRHEEGVALLVRALEARAPAGLQWLYVAAGDTETHASIYHGAALDAFRAFYGEPARVYLPGPLLSGRPVRARTPAEQRRLDATCGRADARRTTPAATRTGHDAIAYECLLYDLGPRPTRGRFER